MQKQQVISGKPHNKLFPIYNILVYFRNAVVGQGGNAAKDLVTVCRRLTSTRIAVFGREEEM